MTYCAVESCDFTLSRLASTVCNPMDMPSIHRFPQHDRYLTSVWTTFCFGGLQKRAKKKLLNAGGICTEHFLPEDKYWAGM